jgi:diacylglycerol kinase family enzyme
VAYADDLAAIRDNLIAELKGETARRAALVAAGKPPPATYTVSGKTVDWTGYVTAMQDLIQKQTELVVAAGGDGGLYEEITRGYS